jgi:hypothetical protein
MTTAQENPTAPPAPPTPPPAPYRPRKSRALPVTIGAVLATIGSILALGGGGILAVAGTDGTVGSGGPHTISTPTTALVSSVADIEDTADAASAAGEPTIGISATAKQGGDVFVGVGPSAEVDRYLAGAPVDEVSDFDIVPFRLDKQHKPGNAAPAPPASQSFWVAQSSGHKADLNWKVRDGSYRFVVMNADGSRGVAAASHFEVKVPYLSTIGLVGLITGLAAVAGGIVLIARTDKPA